MTNNGIYFGIKQIRIVDVLDFLVQIPYDEFVCKAINQIGTVNVVDSMSSKCQSYITL